MSRRPSATSIPPLSTPAIHTHAISPSRNIPNVFSKPSNIYPNGHSGLDPDELFTKHTVLEVKAVQQKLRADADAKQEELRLMVGERYRDLLQASTSIISLAHSSQWVSETLDKVHELVLSQKEPPIQERTSSALDDKNLHSLQSLAAHMKLLLDTPEHLWRFIERKKYLQAAWLFLLARVVYRALVQTDNQDEESWTEQGIEVSSEFPLVDRQWDIVSQFRSQIIHKATLSLREIDISPEDICSTLVTLHLLDSRPLIETFSTLLAQRSKALQITLHRAPDQDNANLHNHQLMAVRNVKGAIEKAVIVISKTVGTSRSLFVDDSSTPSMIKQVLKFINSDLAPSVESDSLPPSQLRLTTQSLLASLMPSTQLSLLPSSLNTYKPYVDLESSSSLFSTSVLSQKLEVWLRDSVETFQGCAREWLHHARTVKAVWNIRTSTWQLSQRSEMSGEEKLQLLSVLDNLCQERIIGIWESLLLESSQNFSERLSQSLSSFEVGINQETGASAEGLFITSSLPASPFVSSNAASEDAAFQKYASALKKQLIGRTPLIDGILSGLEQCARTIHQDLFDISKADDKSTLRLSKSLRKDHQPSADIVSTKVLESTDALADGIKDDQSSAIDKLGFLAHTTVELCNSSSVMSWVGCSDVGIREFKQRGMSIFNRVMDRWRSLVVAKCMAGVTSTRETNKQTLVSGPSSQLTQALLALCQAMMRLDLCRNSARRQELAQSCLSLFTARWTENGRTGKKQKIFDILFLRRLSAMQRSSSSGKHNFSSTVIDADNWSTDERTKAEMIITNSLSRTQMLFATLLPGVAETGRGYDKSMFRVVQQDTSPTDANFESALELAKPSPRFGLLLVGSS